MNRGDHTGQCTLGFLCRDPRSSSSLALAPALAVERPPIVGIANFVVKTDNLEEVRNFYTRVLGYDEVFKHRRPSVAAEIAVFKVNDRQYIEVAQTLANEADDKLIQIGFETKDARKLRVQSMSCRSRHSCVGRPISSSPLPTPAVSSMSRKASSSRPGTWRTSSPRSLPATAMCSSPSAERPSATTRWCPTCGRCRFWLALLVRR